METATESNSTTENNIKRVQVPQFSLRDHEQVYSPAEDSTLLQRVILSQRVESENGINRILDMCTGSGIQAITLARTYPAAKIVAADHNKIAVEIARENCINNGAAKVEVINSNIFSKVKGTFDLIVCNPPYLPAHKFDKDDLLNTALVGGKKGNEVILDFLAQAREHLSADGTIFLLFSSFSNKDTIDVELGKSLYQWSLVASDYMGSFESLYVYKIKFLPHLKELAELGVSRVEYLSKGKRGIVLQGKYDGDRVAIKIAQNALQASVVSKEMLFLKKVNAFDIGPRFIIGNDRFLVMEFIDGERILDYFSDASRKEKIAICKKVLEQLYLLDCNGINKLELTNPYKHILIMKGLLQRKPVLIDFERSQFATFPQNVTQFMQFLQGDSFTSDRVVHGDSEKIMKLLQEYKFSRSRKCFDALLLLLY